MSRPGPTRLHAGSRAQPPLILTGIRPGLHRMFRALDVLGHPEESFASVIVGGTNGKGSVSAMMASALHCGGRRTGLYTSPHLVNVRERVQVNGRPVASSLWAWATDKVDQLARHHRLRLTEFEVQTLVCFLIFERAKVEIAVLEVGLGGRLDAVNAVAAPELSVITSIGLDHTDWLGPTLRHIYLEKRGIARSGTPLLQDLPLSLHAEADRFATFYGVPTLTLGHEIQWESVGSDRKTLGQTIRVWGPDGIPRKIHIPFWGLHQARNGALAYSALQLLIQRGWRLGDRAIREGLSRARWPGRFDVLQWAPPVVLDGAHNLEAARALAEAWRGSPWGRQKATLIFACLKDKAVKPMAEALAPIAARVIVTSLSSDRARSVEELVEVWEGHLPTTSAPHFKEAWKRAQSHSAGPILITGSLYLVGEALKYLRRKK
jgi:dihydrofolate synthase/folylpolyglutamate synthase